GVLEFSCGDFRNNGVEVSAPASVKVEYAPYGTSDFFNLPVEQVPEYYYMPGLGYYYRGSLETVNAASPNGWFDLRITLTDSVGNMQRQVISPAFKISSLTGVRDVALQNGVSIYAVQSMIYINGIDNPSVDIYDLSGRHMISTNGNHVDAGLAPGIYIVKASCGKTTQVAKVRIQ
ncbi:MAG: T9SS type A sorting domain-containing protein, partial [Sodaliphilus pleomorphus]|uniref:T9SS type A sorting domain-containing protein n=1 Tax=Sodaliphilus pleomorphus TaxID=2606626 RepID=UPI0024097A8C